MPECCHTHKHLRKKRCSRKAKPLKRRLKGFSNEICYRLKVTWTAPKAGSGCVTFKSTVIEHKDVWYADEGALSKTLCEDEANSSDSQPLILEDCKACDEAKYELTFEGLWSRHTHPKDFPSNGWLTKFSDVIGASHTTEYRFWTYGEPASEGLKEVAEHGSTRQLERELKEEVGHRNQLLNVH